MFKKFRVFGLVLAGAMLLAPAATFAEGLHNGSAHSPERRDNTRVVRQYRSEIRVVKQRRAPVHYNSHLRKHRVEHRVARFHKPDYRR